MAYTLNFDAKAIESDLTTQSTGGIKYPSLQVDRPSPREDDDIKFCFGSDSYHILSKEAMTALDLGLGHLYPKAGSKVEAFMINKPFRIIPVGIPGLCVYNKDLKRYEKLVKGLKFKVNGRSVYTSIARMLFAMKCGDTILTNESELVQLFTLKLSGMKTSAMLDQLKEIQKTIADQRGKPGESCLHLCSFELTAKYHLFEGSEGSSGGVMYRLGESIELLNASERTIMSQLARDPEVQKDLRDPYKVDSGENNNNNVDPDTIDF